MRLLLLLHFLSIGLIAQSIETIDYYYQASKVNDWIMRGDDLLLATDVGIFVLDPNTGGLRDHWTVASAGLPSNRVESIAVSPTTQSLYIGTYDIGAARQTTDGEWQKMSYPTALLAPFQQILTYSIAFNQEGDLWAGTSQGLWKRSSAGEWSVFGPNHFNNLVHAVWEIIETPSGELIFGGNVVFKATADGFEIITPSENGNPDIFAYGDLDLHLTSTGDIWIFTDAGEAALWSNEVWTTISTFNSPELPFLDAKGFVFEDSDGRLWKKAANQYNVYDGQTWSATTDLPFDFEDPEYILPLNGQWFGFKDAAWYQLSDEQEPQLRTSMEDWPWANSLWYFKNDLSGNLWAHNSGSSLVNLTTNETLDFSTETPAYYSDFHFATDQTLWANSIYEVYQADLSGNLLKTYSVDNGDFPDTYLRDIVIDGSGSLWLRNGDDEIYRLQGEVWEEIISFPSTSTYSMLPGANDNVYLFTIREGNEVEMAELQSNNTVVYHALPAGWSGNFFRGFPGEQTGDVWISNMQTHELARWDGNEWNRMPLTEEWEEDGIPVLFREVAGKIWLSGIAQMALWDGTNWSYYNENSSLWDTGRIAYGGIDDLGNIWLAHQNTRSITHLKTNELSTDIAVIADNPVALFTWPNPGVKLISGNWKQGEMVRIWTMSGQLVGQHLIKTEQQLIDCQSWAAGTYLIDVSGENYHKSGLFIKQ